MLRLHNDKQSDPNARVQQVKEEILSVDVIDVAVVAVSPACGPRVHKFETVTAVLKLGLPSHDHALCPEMMALTKVSVEFVVGDVSTLARRGPP